MPQEASTTETASHLARIGEDLAELKGEMRQIDKRLSSMEQGQQDLRRDIRQVLYVVILGILIPILLYSGGAGARAGK